MARLEVKSSGSPVLTLQPNEFLRVLKAYPIAETFPFRLAVSLEELSYELLPGGNSYFEAVKGLGVSLAVKRFDIGAKNKSSYICHNLILRPDGDIIRLTLPATTTPRKFEEIGTATGWSDPCETVKVKLAHLKEEGLALYRAAKDKADREAERERVEREQAAIAERARQEELRRQQAEARAAKRDPREELEEERRKARETMEALRARAEADLNARLSATAQPSKTSGRKTKVRDGAPPVRGVGTR